MALGRTFDAKANDDTLVPLQGGETIPSAAETTWLVHSPRA